MGLPGNEDLKRFTIKKKLALLLIGFALIPSAVVGAVSYWYAKNLSEKYALNVESLAAETSKQIVALFPAAQNTLVALSYKSEFSDVTAGVRDMELVAISEVMAQVVKMNRDFSMLLVTDTDRVIHATEAPGSRLIGKELEESPEYLNALGGKMSHSRLVKSDLRGTVEMGVWIHVPLYSAWDKVTPIGVLSGLFSIKPIAGLIRQTTIEGRDQDTSRYVELVAYDGALLVSPPFMDEQEPGTSRNVLEGSEGLAPIREGASLTGSIGHFNDPWGEKVVGFSSIPEFGVRVLALVDRSVVFRQIKTLRDVLALFTILVIGLSALSAWPISLLLTRPISVAVDIAKQVAACDLTADVKVTSMDETGQLLEAIRTMTQNLNSLVGRVKQSSIQLVSTTSEMAAAARLQESAVHHFGASTDEIVTAASEISATSQELVGTMSDITTVASRTAVLAESGRSGLAGMEATMHRLEETSGAVSSKLGVIREKTANIGSVITTISKVADRTNLLSLNAAIEAEKAGEYGLGFAVVAREIRRLADQTAIATLDVEEMVKAMQWAVSSGVTEMERFTEAVRVGAQETGRISEQLTEIIEKVQALAPRFAAVDEGMQSQSKGALQISHAILSLSDAARQTSDSLHEFNAAAQILNEAVQGLRDEVSSFKVRSG